MNKRPRTVVDMDQQIVRRLEEDIEKAIAEVILHRLKGWKVPLLRNPARDERIIERLLDSQQANGGFPTDYNDQGQIVGKANVETTSLAILALDASVKS